MWTGADESAAVIWRRDADGGTVMKVTVCFNGVRVVVPCGDGNGSVRDLMLRAATRYKKATGRPADSWVTVHSLKSSDGGLLDPDDRLNDVADDREQIVAEYEEREGRSGQHGGGDGTSASSDGTRSPIPFTNGERHEFQPFSRVDIEVTGPMDHSCSLQVRRGSEPALNQLCPLPQFPPPPAAKGDTSKRWSAAPIIDDEIQASSTPIKNTSFEHLTPPGEREEASGDERERPPFSRFARDSNRLSMQIGSNNESMWRWADAADRVAVGPQQQRWEPVGGSNGSADVSYEDERSPSPAPGPAPQQELVVLTDVRGPLGIHVVPESEVQCRDVGLHVQRVDPGGAIQRDGRISVGDRIVQINGHNLRGTTFQRAQEIFSSTMSSGGELRLLVEHPSVRVATHEQRSLPDQDRSRSRTPVNALDADDRASSRVATVTPTKKVPVSLSSRTQNVMLSSNTRKLGRRLTLQLVKGPAGLGFSVTTRDNPAGGHAPVYVKNILPQGAAVEDGRLRPGDRLLEIDGAPVTGLGQQDVVQMLRAVRPSQPVHLVLSRQEPDDNAKKEPDGSPKLPRPLPADPEPEPDETEPTRDKEVLVFDIPVHDSERAGLGVSVKGKTTPSRVGPVDVGIYIKSVIHGGAASKDGRLQRNDQLIDVNHTPLLGLSNSDAMETLRRAMCQEGPKPGVITLTVARRSGGEWANSTSGRDSVNSMLSNSSGEVLSGWRGQAEPDHSGHSEESQVTIVQRAPPVPARPAQPGQLGHPPGRSPVVDRLTGRNNIRNESYYRATHDATWEQAPIHHQVSTTTITRTDGAGQPCTLSPTINMPSSETVLIETDRSPSDTQEAPQSQLGGEHAGDGSTPSGSNTDVAYASQTSLDNPGVGFTRDQLGRQSISEKRHASKDAKNTDTYKRTQRAREEREQQRRQIEAELKMEEAAKAAARRRQSDQIGPSLGMKKSSSLESLQTMVHELALAEDAGYPRRGAVPAVRGRGCNESFRAAVDRSYEAPLGDVRERMETLAVPGDADFVSCVVDEEERTSAGATFNRDRAARQSSMSSGAVEGKRKRRSGLLKGLGSMFRFGRHRKSSEVAGGAPRLTAEELKQQQDELNRIAARRKAEDEQRRVQQQYQRQQQQLHRPASQGEPSGILPPVLSDASRGEQQERAPSRADRMQQLRQQHQQRHASRHGVYVTDDAEERAEQRLRQAKCSGAPHDTDRLNNNVAPDTREGPFVRTLHGPRSSEYFRNPRPQPISALSCWGRTDKGSPESENAPGEQRNQMAVPPDLRPPSAAGARVFGSGRSDVRSLGSGRSDPRAPVSRRSGSREPEPREMGSGRSDPRPAGSGRSQSSLPSAIGVHPSHHQQQFSGAGGHPSVAGMRRPGVGAPDPRGGASPFTDPRAPGGRLADPRMPAGGSQSQPEISQSAHPPPPDSRGHPADPRARNKSANHRNHANGVIDPRVHPGGPADHRGHSCEPRGRCDPQLGRNVRATPVSGSTFDPYELMCRPGSRAGLVVATTGTDSDAGSDQQRFGHYANYEQIQHHLRRQHLYHSQRGRRAGDPPVPDRPSSNYFEYESVQAMMRLNSNNNAESQNRSLPRHHERARSHPAPPLPPPAPPPHHVAVGGKQQHGGPLPTSHAHPVPGGAAPRRPQQPQVHQFPRRGSEGHVHPQQRRPAEEFNRRRAVIDEFAQRGYQGGPPGLPQPGSRV